MLCERAQELFSDYHEGAVKTAMLVPLERHLDECSDCRMRLEGMRDVWTMLDTAPLVEPPADFRAAVWARIDASEAERARTRRPGLAFNWRSLFRPATLGWAAAALVLLMLAPAAIPGARTKASLWFPWNLIYAAPAPQVSVGQPQITVRDGRRWIDLQVTNNSSSMAQVEVSLEGTTSSSAIIQAPAGSSSRYPVAPADGGSRLKATWSENGSARSQEIRITP